MRAVVSIAKSPSDKPLPLAELCDSEKIPLRFLEQIVLILRRGGILKSRRGASGGYLLDKPSSKISLSEILELIDGPLELLESGSATAPKANSGLCLFFSEVESELSKKLQSTSIEDIIAKDAQIGEALAFDI